MSKTRVNKHLKKRELNLLTDKVRSEIERIQNRLARETLMEVNQSSGRDEVDSANDEILQRAELRFATRETLYLKKLRKTMALVEAEEYGMCEDCGDTISFQRLFARPTSTMCITCKEESERDELQCFHGRQSKSLGQSMSAQA